MGVILLRCIHNKLLCFNQIMSLLKSTGVDKKLNLSLILLCLGFSLTLFGSLIVAIVGIILIIGAFLIAKFYVKCPSCKCNWYFDFLSKANWDFNFSELYQMENCPQCNLKHNKPLKQDF